MILKAKKINKFVNYKDLKMESIHNVINLIKPNVYDIYWPKRCIFVGIYPQWSSKVS